MECIAGFVSGRVQGVFFRAATKSKADALGVLGWVRNTDDGRVELKAQGDEKALQEFIAWLHHGPDAADVTRVDVSPSDIENFQQFDVRY